MKDIYDAIDSRIRNPMFGYFVIALLAINWQSFFYLLADNASTTSRITHFNNTTDFNSLIIYPVITAILYALIYPWVNYLFMQLTTKPTELKNSLQAQSEHKLLIKRQELEDARNRALSLAENELIKRAKRDEQLDEIQDEKIREKLKREIEQLRVERDNLRNSSVIGSSIEKLDSEEYKKLMELADDLRTRAGNTTDYDDRENFKKRARELEDRAHALLQTPDLGF